MAWLENKDASSSSQGNEFVEAKEDRYPKIGPFYFYKNRIIAPDEYQRRINPVNFIVEGVIQRILADPKEHRDMWDRYMIPEYPELKKLYDDDHKALPRGRVDYTKKDDKLSFFITLDKCIHGREAEITERYNLKNYPVEFSYGSMNYKCKNCK
jgi:hypothetical protein